MRGGDRNVHSAANVATQATPWVACLLSRKMNTRMDSPGSTAGFITFANSFTLRTEIPWTRATLFRLKSS
jgi:hypothetical protein